jgi:hypothetical protein
LRCQCLIVYAAAGVAKLSTAWLSGRALEQLVRAGLIGGPLWRFGTELVGIRGAAATVAAAELGIVVLLSVPRLRLGGVALGLTLHAALGTSLVVSTFGAQMALYLMLFLPWDPRNGEPPEREVAGLRGLPLGQEKDSATGRPNFPNPKSDADSAHLRAIVSHRAQCP